jgi:thimet oligopeptidase
MKLHVATLALTTTLVTLSALAAPAPATAPAHATAAARGTIMQPAAAEIAPLCEQGLAAARAQVKVLEAIPLKQANAKNMLGGWNKLAILRQNVESPMGLLAETSPNAAVRKAAEACELKFNGLPNEFLQSEALYQRIKAVRTKDAIDALVQQDILADFEDRGIALPAAQRERAKAIFERLDKINQDFSRNVRTNTQTLAFADADLKGVPPDALKGRARDGEGRALFGMDYPERDAIMNNVELESTRQAYALAFSQRGGKANLDLLQEAVTIRRELAALMGFTNYADWSLRRKMAGSAKQVDQFLASVKDRVAALEKKELAELQADKAAVTGKLDAKINSWDVPFYQQRLKKSRYSVDQQQVRAQFPVVPTIDWLLKVSSTLYDVQFKENKSLPTWQADVRGFDVFDGKSGAYMSSFYLDLFPREGKYQHAAAFAVQRGSMAGNVKPVSVLVTNFNREGFDQRELETLFHEFGHVMHGVLSKARYVFHSGTAVKRDFVEAPSQIYEEWSRRPESLALFANVCPTCQPIDAKLIERMNASRGFGQGLQYARQHLYAAWDMSLHGAQAVDPMANWIAMEGQTPLGHVEGSMTPAAFSHVIRGYAAGYYGYMWSEVLALDMLSRYGNNVMDTRVGARYRKMILERGGEQHPAQLVEAFLGRKPSPEAFFQEITGQRHAPGK